MSEPVFVDTNIFVYGRDKSEKVKQPKAAEWVAHLWRTRAGRLSVQVLHEFYVTVTVKLNPGVSRAAARKDVLNLMAWRPIVLDGDLLESAWRVQDRYKTSWWDSLILAAAQAAGCRYLLSEDFQDGRIYGDVRVVNPFLHGPRSLGDDRGALPS